MNSTLKKIRHPRSLVVILLLPLVVLGIGMWALTGRIDNMDTVPAAVVNLDEGTTMEVDGEEQEVPLGRALAGALTQPGTLAEEDQPETTGFDWQLTTEDDATEGLKDGTYAAVVVIPEDFSDNLGSIGTTEAKKAEVQVYTNDASSATNAAIGDAVTQAAAASLGKSFTEQYLDGLYVGFNDMQDNFQQTADGAGELADGSDELTDGIDELADGTGELADGADELADGTDTFADGMDQLADGADELTVGTSGLAQGLNGLADGVDGLATGVAGIDTGVNGDGTDENPGLVGGGDLLLGGLKGDGSAENPGLVDGSDQLASGVEDLADGTGQYADGVGTAYDGLHEGLVGKGGSTDDPTDESIVGASSSLADGATQLSDGADEYADGVEQLSDGSQQTADGATQVADGTQELSDTLAGPLSEDQPAEYSSMNEAAAAVQENCTADGDPEACYTASQVLAGYAQATDVGLNGDGSDENPGLVTGTAGVSEGAHGINDGIQGDGTVDNPGLAAGARGIADGADEYADGIGSYADGVQQFSAGLDTAFQGDGSEENPGLIGGAEGLADGTDTLAEGARGFADGMPELVDGVEELVDGLHQLGDGVSELSDGAVQLADGAHQSAGGATELSEGVGTFADGTRQSADGAGTLAEGTRGLADGTGELADGTDQLADGSGELSDGTRELADGLQEGADEIPTYTESERETMSQMGAEPVTTNSVRENEASGASTATFPFVVALALWLGAFATFLLLPTLNPRLLQSAVPMWRVVLRSLLPSLLVGVVQAVAVLATLTFIGIEPVSALGVGLITLAGSVMFMALHQALVTLFGERVGRVLSIVLMVLQVVVLVGIVPVQSAPQLLQDVASFMPITILSQGLVHAALGGTLTHISSTLLAILTWFAVSVILTLVFSRGARTLRPSHGKLRTSSRKEPVAA